MNFSRVGIDPERAMKLLENFLVSHERHHNNNNKNVIAEDTEKDNCNEGGKSAAAATEQEATEEQNNDNAQKKKKEEGNNDNDNNNNNSNDEDSNVDDEPAILEDGTVNVQFQSTPAAYTDTHMTTERRLNRMSHFLDVARELFGMDRHVELADYLYGLEKLLLSWGVPDEEAKKYPGGNEERLRLINTLDRDPSQVHREQDEMKKAAETTDNILTFVRGSLMYIEATEKAREVRAILSDVMITPENTNQKGSKDPEKWTATSNIDAHGHGTYYKKVEGLPTHSFRVTGILECDIISVVAVLGELDLYKEWFPMCNFSKERGRVNDFHRFSSFCISCPWPVTNREVFMGGFGCDNLSSRNPNEQSVVIMARSYDPQSEPIPREITLPDPDSRNVMAYVNRGGFVMQPMPQGKTKVTFIMNVDPKLQQVPMALINYMSGKLIWVLLRQLGIAAKKVNKKDSPYYTRRLEQKALYEYLEKRATEVLPQEYLWW